MIGDALQKARTAAGMTQEELAFEAQVDRTYISQLENNRKSPTIEVLFRLCAAMGVKPSKLIAKVEKQHNL